MKHSAKQYASALMEVIETTNSKDHDQVLDNFVKVLAENNDLRLFEQIEEEFHKLELAKKGIKQVEVTSAHPITKANEQQIIHELNKLVRGNLDLKKKVDEGLIGGVVIRMEDQIIDASVKNNLQQLENELGK